MAKKKKAVVVKKRNPQDATLRNIRALKSRVSRLEVQLADAQKDIAALQKQNNLSASSALDPEVGDGL